MSIFGKIMSAIFGDEGQGAPLASPAISDTIQTAAPTPPPPVPASATEVEQRLRDIAAKKGAKSNYDTSIVDLMKLLGLDSSLGARKELAKELGYTGDSNDSASMNIWLHKQVMTKLAANGGKLPPEIKH